MLRLGITLESVKYPFGSTFDLSKSTLIEIFLPPSLNVTVLVPAVKHLESSKSTEEPVPPTLNASGKVTVPKALIDGVKVLLTVHVNVEKVINSSPA